MKISLFLISFLYITSIFSQNSTLPFAQNSAEFESLNEINENLKFNIYPTPLVDGRLEIESESPLLKRIQIYNILGEVVFETSTYLNTLELFSLDTGIYVFLLTQGDRSGIKRLVVP